MLRKLFALLLPVLLVAALVAGCGDDESSGAADAGNGSAETGESGGGSSEPLTASSLNKAQFVKRANAICKEQREDRVTEVEEYIDENTSGEEGTPEQVLIEAIREVYVPGLQAQVEGIRELGAPRGEVAPVERILESFETAAEDLKGIEDIEDKAEIDRSFTRSGQLAQKYGLDECTVT